MQFERVSELVEDAKKSGAQREKRLIRKSYQITHEKFQEASKRVMSQFHLQFLAETNSINAFRRFKKGF